ncbi:MAG: hypothetical protein GWO20_14555 [Candidatus Korarchaeota archaeon]|nr:hypothetical protein [Candidatus Korarchaeota archaeon]NIU84644.1 hypothetical protein [Candidatus Thorarchaeota archaeon]NIW14670.1 hypothetical protein [Candidatus Thorarchaeota archaeon]NIW52746.1 hypothetical protein [Candidatus Korarchaeota archaeon]
MDKHEPEINEGGPPGSLTLDKIVKVKQAELHMSPVQFKSIARWMIQHVKRYEDKFGEIKVEQKGSKKPGDVGYT